MKNNIFTIIFFLMISNAIMANITLPNFFSDNMVLQRNSEITIWGWANTSEEVIIIPSWNNKEYKVKANTQAQWQLKVPTPKEGGPYSILIKGYNEIVLKNILIGEVWLCSGQSNMEMSANWGIKNGQEETQKANYPNIRFFTVEKATATSPQNNLSGNWKVCTPETMKNFSAAAYFFAKRIQEDLKNVPIGMINSSWGGTPAEIWIPENIIQNNEELSTAAKKINPTEYGPMEPARAYNAMIHPLVGFKIAGILWYQGENNVGATSYKVTFSALINSWRNLWKEDLPFYFVQISPFNYGGNKDSGVIIRDAQRQTLQLVNTGMVVTSDISTIDDIHPKDKISVGIRLANLALANIYKTNTALVNSPVFRAIKIEKNKVLVHFDYAEGLHFGTKKTNQFEIAGADNVFYISKSEIKNNEVILYSDKVKNPTRIRFAWGNTIQSDLFNKANLPASSFITD